jgi:two-component sensor histidine kinase
MATNASKYGALSVPEGKISVQWTIEPNAGDDRFHMCWQEHSGPDVSNPGQSGFGRILIERIIAQKLNATVLLTFGRPGVVWTVDAAASDVVADLRKDTGR